MKIETYTKAEAGPNHSVIYFTEDGRRFLFSGGGRAWRNSSTGNLVTQRWLGEKPS